MKRFLSIFRFRRCQQCGKIYWAYNHALEAFCSVTCLFKYMTENNGFIQTNLRRSVNDILDHLNEIRKRLEKIIRKEE